MDLSVIIVNHNTKQLTTQTIKSIFNTTQGIEYEIIVVDNSSKEREYFEMEDSRVKILLNVENKGFGHACNIGAKRAVGRYLLFLNSDTLMQNYTLERAVKYMDTNKRTGCLGIKTLLPDGSFDHGCKRGFPTPFNSLCYILGLDRLFPKSKKLGGYRLSYLDNNKTHLVDSVSGAFMLIPRAVFQKSGGFDESIFMYGEDIDLCYIIKEMGFDVVYYADVYMIHLKGQSGLKSYNPAVLKHFHNGLRIFYDKHYKDKNNCIVNFSVHFAIKLRYFLMLLKGRLKK